MKRLYIDIDGGLITAKNHQTPEGIDDFIEFITSDFECYWLTTHCKGDASPCIHYLSQFLSDKSLQRLRQIKETNWNTLKIEAIRIDVPFYWLDDYPMIAETKILETHGKLDSLIKVNLKNSGELARIKNVLQP